MLPPAKSLANLDRSSLPSVCDGTDIERLLDRTLAESRTKADTRGDPSPNPASSGSLLAAAAGLSPLIWPPNDRSPMGSGAPRSVGSVGTTNRTVVPITVMVRICLANSHSPIGADASGSVDAIGTSGCMARLRKHERSKCNYDGEHHCAISSEAQRGVFHIGYLWVTGVVDYSSLLCSQTPGHNDRGFCRESGSSLENWLPRHRALGDRRVIPFIGIAPIPNRGCGCPA